MKYLTNREVAFVAVHVLGYGDHSRKSGICVNYPALEIAE